MEEDISTDLCVLRSHLDGMLERVQQNSLKLRRFQAFEMRLLSLNSLAEMITHILEDTKAYFDLDVINFCLIDDNNELEELLLEDGYALNKNSELILLKDDSLLRTTFGSAITPYLGVYKSIKCTQFFPDLKKKLIV